MHLSPAEQYDEVLSALPKPPICNRGEKYDRFKRVSSILHDIFTPDIWNEWDSNFEVLKDCFDKKIDPREFDDNFNLVHEGKYPSWFLAPVTSPRLASYLINALIAFGNEKIEECLSRNHAELSELFTQKELIKFGGGWSNACETGRHIFQNFTLLPGKGVELSKDLNPKEIKRLMQGSAMLDTATFNRFSIRNFNADVTGVLKKSNPDGISDTFVPGERVGCPAVRRFHGSESDTLVFDELFARICTIYGYTPLNSLRKFISQSTAKLCPHHK